jgi:hypothetical protein
MAPILSRLSSLGGGGIGGFSFGKKKVSGGANLATVPVTIKLWGAGGNTGQWQGGNTGKPGGGGGFASASFLLEPGTTLKLRVGGGGVSGSGRSGSAGQGGYNAGGNANLSNNGTGGGGGGMTSVCIGTHSFSNALIVSGGGGGGNYYYGSTGGGAGGGTEGGSGGSTSLDGGGGTQSAGGTNPYSSNNNGSAFQGGSCVTMQDYTCGAGGGGGGYYGGAAGAGCGDGNGGGGSGYVTSGGTVNTKQVITQSSTLTAGSGRTVGGSGDPDYPGSSTGYGSSGGSDFTAYNGAAKITINGSSTSYSYTGSEVTITVP